MKKKNGNVLNAWRYFACIKMSAFLAVTSGDRKLYSRKPNIPADKESMLDRHIKVSFILSLSRFFATIFHVTSGNMIGFYVPENKSNPF